MAQPAPITLNVRDVALAAKKAFDEGRLSAQGPTPDCKYRDRSGLPCAVGAALSDEDARRFDERVAVFKGASVTTLIADHLVATDDQAALWRLQNAHDTWCDVPSSEQARERFVAALNSILAEA